MHHESLREEQSDEMSDVSNGHRQPIGNTQVRERDRSQMQLDGMLLFLSRPDLTFQRLLYKIFPSVFQGKRGRPSTRLMTIQFSSRYRLQTIAAFTHPT